MSLQKGLITLLVIAVNLFLIWGTPRFFTFLWGAGDPWTSFAFQYTMGALFFLNGLWLVFAAGACKLHRKQDRFWFHVMWIGFVCYFAVHWIWIWIAQNIAVRGV